MGEYFSTGHNPEDDWQANGEVTDGGEAACPRPPQGDQPLGGHDAAFAGPDKAGPEGAADVVTPYMEFGRPTLGDASFGPLDDLRGQEQ